MFSHADPGRGERRESCRSVAYHGPMTDPGTPTEAAGAVALAVDALSRLTLRPTGQPGWESVADISAVVARLQLAAERLPQVLDQLARHLASPSPSVALRPAADHPGVNPEHLVGDAVAALGAAEHHAMATADALARAHDALGNLTVRHGGDPVGE